MSRRMPRGLRGPLSVADALPLGKSSPACHSKQSLRLDSRKVFRRLFRLKERFPGFSEPLRRDDLDISKF